MTAQWRCAVPVLVILTGWEALLVIFSVFVLSLRPGHTPSKHGLKTCSAPSVPPLISKRARKRKRSSRFQGLWGGGAGSFPRSRYGTTSLSKVVAALNDLDAVLASPASLRAASVPDGGCWMVGSSSAACSCSRAASITVGLPPC